MIQPLATNGHRGEYNWILKTQQEIQKKSKKKCETSVSRHDMSPSNKEKY